MADPLTTARAGPLRLFRQVRDTFARTERTALLLRGSAASTILWVASLAVRLALSVVLARLLGPAGFGTYSYALTVMTLVAIPTTMGLDQISLRFVATYKETRSWGMLHGFLRYAMRLGGVAGVTVAVLAVAFVLVARPGGAELRATMWISFTILPVIVLTQIRQSSLRGLDRPILAQLPENILYPLGFIAALFAGRALRPEALAPSEAAVASGIAWVIAFGVGTVFLLRTLPREVHAALPAEDRPAWKAAIPSLIVSSAAYHLLSKGDILVLGVFGTPHDVGLYAVATRAAEQTMMFLYSVISIAGASLFAGLHASGDREELQRFTTLMAKTIVWGSLPLYAGLMVFAPSILGLFGGEFVEAAGIMRILITTFYLATWSGFVIVMGYMSGHHREVAVAMAAVGVANVLLCAALVPPFGPIGAAIAAGTSLITLHGILVAVLYRRIGVLSLPIDPKRFRRADQVHSSSSRSEDLD